MVDQTAVAPPSPEVVQARLNDVLRRRAAEQDYVVEYQKKLDEHKRNVAELDEEATILEQYLKAWMQLKQLDSPESEQRELREHPHIAVVKEPEPVNWEASTTREVACQILKRSSDPMRLDAMLSESRKFEKWSSGDDERDKERLDSALRRGKGKFFHRRANGWILGEGY